MGVFFARGMPSIVNSRGISIEESWVYDFSNYCEENDNPLAKDKIGGMSFYLRLMFGGNFV